MLSRWTLDGQAGDQNQPTAKSKGREEQQYLKEKSITVL
jgi:hypothetical protein